MNIENQNEKHLTERKTDQDALIELLNKSINLDAQDEWIKLLEEYSAKDVSKKISVVIFRLGGEWLAIKTHFFREIVHLKTIHSIPKQSSRILRGVANINGELKLCVNLHALLEIQAAPYYVPKEKVRIYERMIIIVKEGDLWVFPVDEIQGIVVLDVEKIENVPVSIMKSNVNYLSGIFVLQDKTVGLIDEDLVFYSLKRKIL